MDKVPSVFNNLRPLTIGFDDVFDHFETLLDDDFSVSSSRNNYPPYDIRKVGENRYNIEAALAGFNKKDIEVIAKDNTLTIKTKKEKTSNKKNRPLMAALSFRCQIAVKNDRVVHYKSIKNIKFQR